MREDAAEDRRRFLAGVYRESGAQLYRYALMILAHPGDAEDVLQQVYRRDHAGAPPDSLQALVPGYLKSVLEDPFSGQPPVFKLSADGYALYSVDINRKDDGGTLYGIGTGTKERWLSRDTTAAVDLGIRVPLAPRH